VRRQARSRIAYCVAYDIVQDRIAAMRCHGELAALMPDPSQNETTNAPDCGADLHTSGQMTAEVGRAYRWLVRWLMLTVGAPG
jgi:hypothetical protein